ncbi:MAG: hypothetical protein ACXACI_17185 [Candidatus Hodarchaeales archaeon]
MCWILKAETEKEALKTMTDLSPIELRELLHYMNRVKSFERISRVQTYSTKILIWGFLILVAGVAETLLNLSRGSLGTAVMWILAFGAMLAVDIFSRYQMLTKDPFTSRRKWELFLTFSIIVLIVLSLDLILETAKELIWPLWGVYFAWFFYTGEDWLEQHSDILQRNYRRFVPLMSLFSVIVNLLGWLLFVHLPEFETFVKSIPNTKDPEKTHILDFMSLIFAFFFGMAMVAVAFANKYSIDKYFASIEQATPE